MSPQKTPKHWIKISDWPLTGSGKIKKFVLKEKYMRGDFEKENSSHIAWLKIVCNYLSILWESCVSGKLTVAGASGYWGDANRSANCFWKIHKSMC